MEKSKKILDASVMVKGFSEEINSEKAHRLIKKHLEGEILIIVPELIFLEITNALKYKKKDEESIKKVSKDLFNFQFKVEKITEPLLSKAIQISIKNNLTIYDSLYIAISQFYGAPLITADSALYKITNVIPLEKCED